jgi:hypothetical protein
MALPQIQVGKLEFSRCGHSILANPCSGLEFVINGCSALPFVFGGSLRVQSGIVINWFT